MTNDTRTVFQALVGDGRFLWILTGLILFLSGLFVMVQSLTGHFLPHDVSFIGLDAVQLSQFQEGTVCTSIISAFLSCFFTKHFFFLK